MMKYFLAITLIAAVASAVRPLRSEFAEIQEIIAAIQSPSTDPATAAALEQMLLDVLGIKPEPVVVGPAIINPIEGISVGPAIVPFPLPDGGAVAEEPIVPGPAVVPAPAPSTSPPLVQIILNIRRPAGGPIAVSPVEIGVPEIPPTPVQIAESAPEPEPSPISPPIAVNPIGVVPEPVQIGVPVIPEAAVVLPEQLN